MASDTQLDLRTSDPRWIEKLGVAYRDRRPVVVLDDARVGIDPSTQSIRQMGARAGLSPRDWMAVAVALGVSVLGAGLLVAAIVDPEPYSKLGLTIVTAAVLTVGGGFSAIRILTDVRPPRVKAGPHGIEISWD
jgi:hypothetical protein